MDSKKIRKAIANFFGRLALQICSLIVKVLPRSWLYGFAERIAAVGYRLTHKQKRIALDSLAIAFGQEKTRQEIEEIAKDCFTFMAKSAVELLYLMDKPVLLKRSVQFVNQQHLLSALKKGKGVILVSAHFGNFPLLMAKMSLEGFRIAGIMRPMRDTKVERMFLVKRQRLGIKTIYSQPRNVCVEETIKSLRNNEAVFIPLDQNFGTGGIFVDFFGRKAATATGPVVLAQRTKAALLPCFIVRQKDDTHSIIFEPPLELVEGATAGETIAVNIQKLTDIIEIYIRRYPAEWGWIHRRWKTKQQ